MEIFLIQKRLGGQFDPSCVFFLNVSAKAIVNSWFFVTFNIILIHIIENFIEIRLEDTETFFDNIIFFHRFLSIS